MIDYIRSLFASNSDKPLLRLPPSHEHFDDGALVGLPPGPTTLKWEKARRHVGVYNPWCGVISREAEFGRDGICPACRRAEGAFELVDAYWLPTTVNSRDRVTGEHRSTLTRQGTIPGPDRVSNGA